MSHRGSSGGLARTHSIGMTCACERAQRDDLAIAVPFQSERLGLNLKGCGLRAECDRWVRSIIGRIAPNCCAWIGWGRVGHSDVDRETHIQKCPALEPLRPGVAVC